MSLKELCFTDVEWSGNAEEGELMEYLQINEIFLGIERVSFCFTDREDSHWVRDLGQDEWLSVDPDPDAY